MTGRVWYRDIEMTTPFSPMDTVERLAFRFDLQVGDTFDLSTTSLGFPDSLEIVDSIRFIDGLKYIYFRAHDLDVPITFIEGVGCNLGVFWKYANMGYAQVFDLEATYLLCSYKNGEKTPYHNRKHDGDCFPRMHVGDQNELSQTTITLYPQPGRGTIRISHGGNQPIKRIQIFTSQGRLIRSLAGDNITQLDTGDLSAGLYYIKLFSDQGYLTGKPLAID